MLDDLEVQKCAHAQSKSFSICIIYDDKISHSIFIEIKISFFASLISDEWESYSYTPEMVIVLPINSKILGGLLLRFFFLFSIYDYDSVRNNLSGGQSEINLNLPLKF